MPTFPEYKITDMEERLYRQIHPSAIESGEMKRSLERVYIVNPPEPLIQGTLESPQLNAAISELDAYLDAKSVRKNISAKELCFLPKMKTRLPFYSVPKTELWARMVSTLRDLWIPLRTVMDMPLFVRGYRPPAYNKAVGGAKNSRHLWFEALDICLPPKLNTLENRKLLARNAAHLWLTRGEKTNMGLGIYGSESNPSHIHIDAGYRKRLWGSTPFFIRQVTAELNYATDEESETWDNESNSTEEKNDHAES